MADDFLEVLELDLWRRVDLGQHFEFGELIVVLYPCLGTGVGATRATIGNALPLVCQAHLLVKGLATVRSVQQGVLLVGIDGQMIVAAHAGIDKLEVDLLANSLEVAVAPILKGIGGSLATAFFHRTAVAATRGMRVNLVGWTPHNVNAPTVGSRPWDSRRKMFVGVGDAAVVLFLEFVLRRVRSRIAAQPELFDKLVTLLVVRKLLKADISSGVMM